MEIQEQHEYLARTYKMDVAKHKVKNGIDEFDAQMMSAIAKMKEKYKEHTNRRTAIVLTQDQLRALQHRKEPVTTKPEAPKRKIAEKKPSADVVICGATKMNGEKCTAKAKPGCQFCGRHMPK